MADTATDNIYGQYEPPKGSGQFFALEDGKSARVRFQSDPYAYEDSFKQADGTSRISTRYAWVVYNHEEGKAQILKQSGTFFSSLAALAKDADYGDPTEYDVKITRAGTGTETKYTIVPTKNTVELTPDMQGEVAALDITKDSNEATIIPLKEYVKNGNRFNATTTASGDVIVKDLDDEKADID